jgi:hypothetical protein
MSSSHWPSQLHIAGVRSGSPEMTEEVLRRVSLFHVPRSIHRRLLKAKFHTLMCRDVAGPVSLTRSPMTSSLYSS